jgi:serine/threonine-protein kinase
MDDPSNDPRVGSVLQERYRIIERLAVGSMGIVYRAERLQLGRPLAVKFLHASYAADPTFIQRFERETRVMGRLAHPHCVSVIDFGVDSGPYVVMEFVSGRTLRGLLEGGRQTVERAIHIARQTLAGLAHAHSLGIIHRDIKPANIMLMEATGTGDHVRILDFGLATLREQASSDISHSAIVIGTPNYMSPEQSIGGKADVRSDVYSTGVVLFELLTGRKPFTSEDTFELLSMHRTAPVPRLASVVPDGDFPSDLQRVLDRALAKAPEDRFQNAMEFQSALDEALGPIKPSWSSRAAARARTDGGRRQATRPLPDDASPDYRAALGTARSEARRASRKRRRRPGAVTIGLALLLLGGAAWGGYTVWNGELGANVRRIVERSQGQSGGTEAAGAAAPVEAPSPDEANGQAGTSKDEAAEVDTAAGTTATSSTAGAAPVTTGEPGGGDKATAGETGAAATPPPLGEPASAPEPGGEPTPGTGDPGAAGEAAAGEAPAGETGEDSAEAVDARLPAEEQDEPVAPIGEEGRTVDSAEPETPTEIRRSTEVAAASASVDSIAGAVALIRAGKREEAISALNALRKRSPRSAYVPYLLGHLYFEKGWWTLGMDNYEAAIANNELYRGKRVLNQNVIRALGNRKTRSRAARLFVNTIGTTSLPYLRAAARSDKDPDVRGWTGWLVGRVIQLSRKRGR